MFRPRSTLVALALLTASVAAQHRGTASPELATTLAQIGERVRDYYARAQSIICLETVHLQPLRADMLPDGPPRRLVYELRVAWEPSTDGQGAPRATVQRELISVGGRPPRPRDKASCTDPKPVSPEPLAMLLPERQSEFTFTRARDSRVNDRPTVVLDYRSLESAPPTVTWLEDCVNVELPGMTRGRVWADALTGQVLRLDESLTGTFEFPVPVDLQRSRGAPRTLAIERADTSIRYKPVRFRDPEETVVLPASIDSVTVFRRSGIPRLRTSQVFTEYRRFLTEGRIVDQ
jgi:hypothetical protein